MNKNFRMLLVPALIFIFLFVGTSTNVTAVVHPYSVAIGDKIPYTATILKNGTSVEPLFIKGLNLTQGDNFEMEIFDSSANPTSYWGNDFEVRFVKGEEKGDTFGAQSILFTSNKTFWDDFSNATTDIGGTIYQVTIENNTGTFSWTTDADNFVTVKFDTNDGLVTEFERKSSGTLFNYTHFKYVKGSVSTTPGFEIAIIFPSLTVLVLVIFVRNKKKN
jgi:hypothetical protein